MTQPFFKLQSNMPIIIAEISGNHNQSLDTAFSILKNAKRIGLQYIKLQTYKPDTLTLNSKKSEFKVNKNHKYWGGKNLFELYSEAYTPWEWHKIIFQKALKLGIKCFSTPFDDTAVDLLEKCKCPAYKIASFEITHLPLIKKVALTRKPVIMSTGMASKEEIHDAINTLVSNGCKEYYLLKCTSAYPAKPKDANLMTIKDMIKEFKCPVGLSDHTPGIGVSLAAVALGATMIEKHITPDKNSGAVDAKFSLDYKEFKELIIESKSVAQSLGKIKYGPTKNESDSVKYRRSIYVTKDLKKGDRLTKNNIKIIRPNNGELPKFYDFMIGKKVTKNFKKNTPIKKEQVK